MKKQWFRLDNAALIFPAIKRRGWNNVFRISATLRDDIDAGILNRALADIRPRFPTFFVRLRTGFFWYYLEEAATDVRAQKEYAYPLTHMSQSELKRCCIRVLYFENRIAVEFFHSVTDGTGGLVFLENLTARYIELRYGVVIPKEAPIADLGAEPRGSEICDSFPKHSGRFAMSRREATSYRLHGTREPDGFRHLITGMVPTEKLRGTAKSFGATVSAFLAAVMAESIKEIQERECPERKLKPVKITVPVNLRKLFGEETLRNFVLTLNVGFDPKHGDYSLREICDQMTFQIRSEAVPQKMAARIAANVGPQRMFLVRIMPLFVKTPVMRAIYAASGEKKGCINISNMGTITVPPEMEKYIERFEFIIGVQLSYPNNCSVVSYGGVTYINMIRSIKESELERLFFSKLVALGIPVEIESNGRAGK